MKCKNVFIPVVKDNDLYDEKLSELKVILKKIYKTCFKDRRSYRDSNDNLAMIKSKSCLYHSIL